MIPILCSVAAKLNQKRLPEFSRVICGTSFLDDKTKINFENKFNTELIQQYGMTETLFISFNDKPKCKARSVGKPLAIVKLEIWDEQVLGANQEGQIKIKSPSFYGRYLDESPIKKTPTNDFFFTGDIGYLDDEGYLFITGREKDIIKKGGFAISPNKINNVIEDFDGVNKAYTLSQLDQNVGEEIFSFITASHQINISNLKDYLKTRLFINTIPKEIFQIKKFPLNEMGKISKKDLYNILKK
jgi:acyl-coenzyme A synthetase/AMP-(fatty) acid ligase